MSLNFSSANALKMAIEKAARANVVSAFTLAAFFVVI